MISNEFWENVFSNLGFEKTTILGRAAFKIPICEAIYMSQIMGLTKSDMLNDDWRRKNYGVFIPINENEFLQFPQTCPSIFVEDIILNEESLDHQINPLLSPSLNFIKETIPQFFKTQEKNLIILNTGIQKASSKRLTRRQLLEEIEKEGLKPTDFVFFIVGYNDVAPFYISEDVLEYLTSAFFRKKGFIVDKFNESLDTSRGYPDLFAIKLKEIQNKLIEFGFVGGGFYLNELELLNKTSNAQKIEEDKVIVFEIESDRKRLSTGVTEVEKYLESGFYDEGFAVAPFQEEHIKETHYKVGIITLNQNGKILIRNCPQKYGRENNIKELKKSVERVVKLTLLKNLPLKQIFDLLPNAKSFYDLFYLVDKLDIDKIITTMKQ